MSEYLILVPHDEHRELYRAESRPTAEEALRFGVQEVRDWCEDAEANGRYDDGIDRIRVVEVIGRSEPHLPEHAEKPSRYDMTDLRGACIWTNEIKGPWDTGCGKTVLLYDTPEANQMSYCPYCGKPIRERTI